MAYLRLKAIVPHVVTDGTHTANLTLLGQYSTADFGLAKDSGTGTLVTDPALSASTANPVLAAHA